MIFTTGVLRNFYSFETVPPYKKVWEPLLYRLRPRASRSKGGHQQTVLRIESMAGIWSFRLNFVKIYVSIIIDEIYFYSTFVVITPESSTEFPWISICRLVKPHTNYCVVILKARWLCPAFAESYRFYVWLYQKKLWLFMFEMHLISGITDGWQGCEPPPPAKLNVKTGTLPS